MAKGIFIGLPLATVQAIQTAAVSALTDGKTTMSYSVDGISVSKAFPMSIESIMMECQWAINNLMGVPLPRRTLSDFSRTRIA